MNEFDLIRRYFSDMTAPRKDVVLGVGDDCALLQVPPGSTLAVTTDTLVAGVHFFQEVAPQDLGHKVLAVNLSDLAAMGAEPAWATLALTLPHPDAQWLSDFSHGFGELARAHAVQLVGGDTTQGPLVITLQVLGCVPDGQAMTRSGACVGDLVCVTGSLGDAGLALRYYHQGLPGATALPPDIRRRLERPQPRVEAGLALRGLASAAIDISDGLLADLGHILEASSLGAEIQLDQVPLSETLSRWMLAEADWSLPLASGDDYELCFTLPPSRWGEVENLSRRLQLPIKRIGRIEATPGLRCWRKDGTLWKPQQPGYAHFAHND